MSSGDGIYVHCLDPFVVLRHNLLICLQSLLLTYEIWDCLKLSIILLYKRLHILFVTLQIIWTHVFLNVAENQFINIKLRVTKAPCTESYLNSRLPGVTPALYCNAEGKTTHQSQGCHPRDTHITENPANDNVVNNLLDDYQQDNHTDMNSISRVIIIWTLFPG